MQTCRRHYPGGTAGCRCRSPADSVPSDGGLPRYCGGSAPALRFSRPAQRSLTLRPACSRSRPRRPFPSKASTASLPPPPLRLLPAGATSCRWDLHPLKIHAFPRRTQKAARYMGNAPQSSRAGWRRFGPPEVRASPMAFAGVDARSGQAADARPFGVPGTVEALAIREPIQPSEEVAEGVDPPRSLRGQDGHLALPIVPTRLDRSATAGHGELRSRSAALSRSHEGLPEGDPPPGPRPGRGRNDAPLGVAGHCSLLTATVTSAVAVPPRPSPIV